MFGIAADHDHRVVAHDPTACTFRQGKRIRSGRLRGVSLGGFAVSAFVFGFRSLSCIPDGSEVPIRVGLQDQRATEARSRFFGP